MLSSNFLENAPVSSASNGSRKTGDRKNVATYCYQCTNGPDLLTVGVVNGVATEIEPNFAVRGLHPAAGKSCVKPYCLLHNP